MKWLFWKIFATPRKNKAQAPKSIFWTHSSHRRQLRARCLYRSIQFLSDDLVVVDWRDAPISRIYYLYDEGMITMRISVVDLEKGNWEVRRTLFIRNGGLLRVSNGTDTFVKIDKQWESVEQAAMKLAGGEGDFSSKGLAHNLSIGWW